MSETQYIYTGEALGRDFEFTGTLAEYQAMQDELKKVAPEFDQDITAGSDRNGDCLFYGREKIATAVY